jgi:proteasome lid subunit RPN8/RPN11
MLRIQRTILQGLFAHAERELPIEACGYLAGNDGVITLQYAMKNSDASPEHFSFEVQEQFSVQKDARAKGLKILAIYHSHPETPARPSAEDIKLAYDPGMSYVIVSLAEGKKEIKSFKIQNGIVEHEALEVRDNGAL